jgi:hypothetical protein
VVPFLTFDSIKFIEKMNQETTGNKEYPPDALLRVENAGFSKYLFSGSKHIDIAFHLGKPTAD